MTERYHPHIQALRALAVMGPVMLHLWPADVPASPLTARVTGIGVLGVDLFFVISGFLITGILLRTREALEAGRAPAGAILRAFYARRVLRIFPVYWLLLGALAALGVAGVRGNFWWELGYLTNVLIARNGDWIGPAESHFWSLAVEEQFYLAWPLLVLLVPRRALLPAIVATLLVGPLYRAYALSALTPLHAAVLIPGCLDVLGIGALLAWLWHAGEPGRARLERYATIAGVVGGLLSVAHLAAYLRTPDAWITDWPLARTGYALVFAALVHRAACGFTGGWRRLAELPPVVYLGSISYAVYLFHPVVAQLPGFWRAFGGLATAAPVTYFAVQFALTVALAALSWHLLERPVNALRRHYPYPA